MKPAGGPRDVIAKEGEEREPETEMGTWREKVKVKRV
jgi:hypothetical protein